jgi:hypothetical protein
MIWSGITEGFRLEMIQCPPSITALTYLGFLADHHIFFSLINRFGPKGFIWQQDNAPPHQPCHKVIEERGFFILDWPPHSPDLSPIEMIWSLLKRRLKGRIFKNIEEMFQEIKLEWNSIPQNVIDSLVSSFKARCLVCINHLGGSLNGHWKEVHALHCSFAPLSVPQIIEGDGI